MAAYPIVKYQEQVETLKQFWLRFAESNILQTQKAARALSAGPAPPSSEKVLLRKPPETDIVESLITAIQGLDLSDTQYDYPPLADVHGEWVYGKDASADGPVIFYVHGGGFVYGSVGTARRETRRLADQAGGRCFAVQYRYATEQPFPGSLLDIFVAYISLLAPPDDAQVAATPPNRIVFAGESCGLNALLSLAQVLLYLCQQKRTIKFHGKEVVLQLPAGITGVSGLLDMTCSLPSWTNNDEWDCLQEVQACHTHEWKDQELWPSEPARADIYCERSAMLHPLVSPVAAVSWKGLPPLFLACGEERCTDANLYVAQLAAREGTTVFLQQYEHMCHVWPTVLPKLPHSQHLINIWAAQCRKMAKGKAHETKMERISFETLEATQDDVKNCTSIERQDLLRMMEEGQRRRPLIRRVCRSAKI